MNPVNKIFKKKAPKTTYLPSDYEALLSALNQTALISITDKRGVITFANDRFIETSKYSLRELIGQNHRILKSGQQPDSLFDDLWATISKGKVWHGQIKNRAKDGSYYWVDTSIAPIIGPTGKPERYIAVRFLITNSEEAREKLEKQQDSLVESQAQGDAILHSIGDGLIATDKNGFITLVNPAFEKMTGWQVDEVKGQELISFMPLYTETGGIYETSQTIITDALNGRKSTETDPQEAVYLKRKDGGLFPVAFSVSPIMREKRPLGVVEVFRDITHEKQIDKAKSEFVSLASHQLRTPLTAINWYADMLQAGDAGKLNPEQEKYIGEIRGGNKRMVELVNALLNVSRIDLGTFMIEPEPTDLIQLCKKIVQDSEPRIFERKQKFVENYPKTSKELNIDPQLTRVIVENLVSNAIKYTPVGGSIVLSLEWHKNKLLLTVKDSGYGIPKAQQDKIFGKLFRADNVMTHDTEGTGLGLYIAKSVVQAAGGKIWFESVENKGTTFFVEFPLSGMKAHAGSRKLD